MNVVDQIQAEIASKEEGGGKGERHLRERDDKTQRKRMKNKSISSVKHRLTRKKIGKKGKFRRGLGRGKQGEAER